MGNKTLKYSVLRYSPREGSGEEINLGILFSAEDERHSEFSHIRTTKRLEDFDRKVQPEAIMAILKDIGAESNRDGDSYGDFDIEEYTKYFLHSVSFERPKSMIYENLQEAIKGLRRQFLWFEYADQGEIRRAS